MSNYYTDLGFQQTDDLPEGFRDELTSISSDLPERTRAASLFRDFFGGQELREVANAWQRKQSEIDTWVFEYKWADRYQTRNRRRESQSVIYFRSPLIQFPTIVAMAAAFIKWPTFVTNLFPILIKEDLFPAHPKLSYNIDFYGDSNQSHLKLLSEDVLAFLENHFEAQAEALFARELPPSFETCGSFMTYYRMGHNVAPDEFPAFLNEAEELLKLLTMATLANTS